MEDVGKFKKGEMLIPEEKRFLALLKDNISNNLVLFIKFLLGIFVLLNIISIFISQLYLFYEIFIYTSIVMIFIAGSVIFYNFLQGDLLWATISGIILGLVPLIEIIYHISTVKQDIASLVISIFSIILSLTALVLPIVLVALKIKKNQ